MKAIAEEPIKMNVYEISYADDPNYRVNRTAATAGKAKYNEYLNYSDYCCDTTYMDFLKLIRCRKVGSQHRKKVSCFHRVCPGLKNGLRRRTGSFVKSAAGAIGTFTRPNMIGTLLFIGPEGGSG